MAKGLPFDLDDFREQFTPLEDPQSQINQLHPFESVLIICVMTVLAWATGPTSIALLLLFIGLNTNWPG